MKKQAVILSGGFGTRLSGVVADVPKPMAPIKNRPFLDYVVKTLQNQGFDSFVFLTGYKSECIENYFKGMDNSEFVREDIPLGTGGAIFNAFEKLEDEFFVINGDTFFDIDYSILKDFAQEKSAVIALRYTDSVERYGFVEIDENYKIKSFTEKGKLPENRIDGYISGGIYYIKKELLSPFKESFHNNFISLETEIFPLLVEKGELFALPLGGAFIDIGIPDDYYFAQDLIPQKMKEIPKPALFIDKDGTLIENTEYPHGKDFKIIPSTVGIVKEYKDRGFNIVMITNQAGIAKGKFTHEQMFEGLDGIKEYYKNLGMDFSDIEYCPYHKDGIVDGFSFDTLLRKPNPGMILKACEKVKTDLKNSIMIGDSAEIDKIKLPYLKSVII